jgi:transposase
MHSNNRSDLVTIVLNRKSITNQKGNHLAMMDGLSEPWLHCVVVESTSADQVLFLPPYSPDLNPLEPVFGKV